MSRSLTARRRVKLSVTVDPELLRAVDTFLSEHPDLDRSKVMDEALALWYAQQQDQAMEQQFAAPQSAAERQERAAWRHVQRATAERLLRRS